VASGVNDIENQKHLPPFFRDAAEVFLAAIFSGGFVEGLSSKETV